MELEPLWQILKEADDNTNLYDAIRQAGLSENETVEEIKKLLTLFTKQWEWCGFKTFSKRGFQKKVKELAFSELFGYIELLHKCRDTPPRDPTKGGGLPKWFDVLEGSMTLSTIKPNHPTYKNLLDVRHGRIP